MGMIVVCKLLFSGQNSQIAGETLYCPDVSVGHFQKIISNTAHMYWLTALLMNN